MKKLVLEPFPNLTEISIGEVLLEKVAPRGISIIEDEALDGLLTQKYGRDNLCLRVFPPKVDLQHPEWKGTHVVECTKIQNLFAWEGRAPRIYDLAIVDGKHFAQVMDHVEPRAEAYKRIMQKYNIDLPDYGYYHKTITGSCVDGCLTDFGHLYFRDPESYQESLVGKCSPKGRNVPQQPIPELGARGIREEGVELRASALKLDEIDFKNKSVLDIGCAGGAFCREAVDRGAQRVVGVDNETAGGAYELSNWLGYWNIDYLDLRLPRQYYEITQRTGLHKFNIVLLLAVTWHAGGIPEELLRLTGDIVLFEGKRDTREEHERTLKEHFNSVEFLGYSSEMLKRAEQRRPVFRCSKRKK